MLLRKPHCGKHQNQKENMKKSPNNQPNSPKQTKTKTSQRKLEKETRYFRETPNYIWASFELNVVEGVTYSPHSKLASLQNNIKTFSMYLKDDAMWKHNNFSRVLTAYSKQVREKFMSSSSLCLKHSSSNYCCNKYILTCI